MSRPSCAKVKSLHALDMREGRRDGSAGRRLPESFPSNYRQAQCPVFVASMWERGRRGISVP